MLWMFVGCVRMRLRSTMRSKCSPKSFALCGGGAANESILWCCRRAMKQVADALNEETTHHNLIWKKRKSLIVVLLSKRKCFPYNKTKTNVLKLTLVCLNASWSQFDVNTGFSSHIFTYRPLFNVNLFFFTLHTEE